MGAEWVFVPILTVAGIIATIIVISQNKKIKKYDIDANSPIIINIPKRRFAKGYMLGQVDLGSFRENKNGTCYVKYAPMDVLQGEEVPRPKMVDFIVLEGNLDRNAQGSPSDRRPIWIVTSENPMDYPKNMRDTQLGKFMTHKGLVASMESGFGEGYKEQQTAMATLMKNWSGGEPSAHVWKQMEEKFKKLMDLELMKKSQDEEDKK